jgi:glycosyltransferase involved in cell wall biosynthesis
MKISVICPVYNEGERMIEILKILKHSDFIDEIIFVDDGSDDDTFEILRRFEDKRIKILRLRKNRGKEFALGCGIKKIQGEISIFIDGDLKNLETEHLWKLVLPLLMGRAKCTIGVPLRRKRKNNKTMGNFSFRGKSLF